MQPKRYSENQRPELSRETQATIMMIGEQPGDKEDIEGRPFVGPAGKLLDQCLEEAGIDRRNVYVTNTVKHFKWEPRGKLRIHKKPNMTEIHACRPWLEAELETIKPRLVVCLGAVAAQSLLGSSFKITKVHGKLQEPKGLPPIIATLHPSAILRARTDKDRYQQRKAFVGDLRKVAAFVSNNISVICNQKEMVEAAGVEPASETTVNREPSCFSSVHLCLVIDA